MRKNRPWKFRLSGLAAAAAVLTLTSVGSAVAVAPHLRITTEDSHRPVVTTTNGKVQGEPLGGTFAFRGLPYAASPTGHLRWRPPQAPADWTGVRDASKYGASCPQQPGLFQPPGAQYEDCLSLNVS